MIYFIREIRYPDSPVKIGVVRRDDIDAVIQRLHSLQTGNSRRLGIVALMPGGYRRERWLHRQFASFNIHTEWFRFRGEIVRIYNRYALAQPIVVGGGDIPPQWRTAKYARMHPQLVSRHINDSVKIDVRPYRYDA